MSEGLLTVLKFCFLALLYLFLFRVVRIVVRAGAEAGAEAAVPVAPAARAEPRRRKPAEEKEGRGGSSACSTRRPATGEVVRARPRR